MLAPPPLLIGILSLLPPSGTASCARANLRMSAPTPLIDEYPMRQMRPPRVVELQLQAMQQGDARIFWRFVSPEAKRETGRLRPARYPYLAPPNYAEMPLYAPLYRAREYKIIGGLSISEDEYQCRARVWPAGGDRECGGETMPALPVEYIFRLALQPLERPTCYEDDPMQQGISTGPPFAGCWLVAEVKADDRWGGRGGDDERLPTGPKGGSGSRKRLPEHLTGRRAVGRQRVLTPA